MHFMNMWRIGVYLFMHLLTDTEEPILEFHTCWENSTIELSFSLFIWSQIFTKLPRLDSNSLCSPGWTSVWDPSVPTSPTVGAASQCHQVRLLCLCIYKEKCPPSASPSSLPFFLVFPSLFLPFLHFFFLPSSFPFISFLLSLPSLISPLFPSPSFLFSLIFLSSFASSFLKITPVPDGFPDVIVTVTLALVWTDFF